MEEIGIVKKIDGVTAKVVIKKSSACDHCVKEECDMESVDFEVEAINAANAQVGQTVKVVMKAQTYIKGALLLYILPVLALFVGAIFGKIYLPDAFKGISPETAAVIGGFLMMIISFLIIKIVSSRMEKKTEYRSVIEEIIR
ncbi:MAG: SoxR reducing system RseC family protein [Nitrospirae bacterium]|nr:SoxR reducing system RseC family protein [Nitrospirota bacterium]